MILRGLFVGNGRFVGCLRVSCILFKLIKSPLSPSPSPEACGRRAAAALQGLGAAPGPGPETRYPTGTPARGDAQAATAAGRAGFEPSVDGIILVLASES